MAITLRNVVASLTANVMFVKSYLRHDKLAYHYASIYYQIFLYKILLEVIGFSSFQKR